MPSPAESLRLLDAEGLLRRQRPLESPTGVRVIREGRTLWNFASNDYLGLARHPQIEAALVEGVQRFGAGSAASRLVCGTLPPHKMLEDALAAAKQTEAALTFSSGFATALGSIPTIAGKSDFILLDKLAHACLVDAARLSGATLRVYPHNDLGKLERLLSSTRAKNADARILVVTETVFSMDGDLCPLRETVELTEKFDALLLVDEAHGFGVLGDYLAASREWIDLLANRARSFIYSTAPPPCLAHAAIASLDLIRSEEGKMLRRKLRANISILADSPTPIIPIVLGSNEAALAAAADLENAGFLVPAIRFPTVPRGTARLRVSISAAHPAEALRELLALLPQEPPPVMAAGCN